MDSHRPQSVGETLQRSLRSEKSKQTLHKEVVTVKVPADLQRSLTEAAKKVQAGESLYLNELRKAPERARG